MFRLERNARVWLVLGRTDMRKAINGLSGLVANTLEMDPMSGHYFVFCGRKKNTLKVLYYDRNGYALWYNSLRSYCVSSRRGQSPCLLSSFGSIDESIPTAAVLFRKVIWYLEYVKVIVVLVCGDKSVASPRRNGGFMNSDFPGRFISC